MGEESTIHSSHHVLVCRKERSFLLSLMSKNQRYVDTFLSFDNDTARIEKEVIDRNCHVCIHRMKSTKCEFLEHKGKIAYGKPKAHFLRVVIHPFMRR